MTVARVISSPCPKNGTRRKRSENIEGMLVDAVVRARDFFGNPTAESAINVSIREALNFKAEVDTNAASDWTMCDTDVCRQASLEYKGFTCESANDFNSDCIFTSMCTTHDCGYGNCEVKANGSHYYRVCICKEADMYKYTVSAGKCVKGDLSYKAWMIIAAGAGGLIILILLFAVVILCARRKREPLNPEKYAYDVGYNDRETLMHDRSYDHIDQYHRNPSLKVEDRRIQTSLQTFDNQGYDHWDPDESKETYQSIDRHFQSPNFQSQITRPKITTNRYGEDKLTPF